MARPRHSTDPRSSAHVEAYRRADKHYGAGRYRAALRDFKRALQLAPGDSDTCWAIGNCYTELHRPRLAERAFRKALGSAKGKDRDALLYNLGNALFDQRNFKAAAQLYHRISSRSGLARLARRNLALS